MPFVRLRAISRPIDLVLRKSAIVDVADLRNQLTMTQPYLIPVAFPARPERSALQPQEGPAVVQRLYRWRTPDQSVNIPADSDDVATLATVRTNFAGSGRSSGAGRVLHDMVAEGVACGLHRIERIMRENAMWARPRRRGELQMDDGLRSAATTNLLEPQSAADGPNQKWIADFTYHVADGRLTLRGRRERPVLAARGRLVDAGEQDAQLVADVPVMAIWRGGKPDTLLHHADQRGQYTWSYSAHAERLPPDDRNRLATVGILFVPCLGLLRGCSRYARGNPTDADAVEPPVAAAGGIRVAQRSSSGRGPQVPRGEHRRAR